MSTSFTSSQVSSAKKSWLTMALLYGLPMGLLFSWQEGRPMIAIPAGLIAGAVFATILSGFASRQTQKLQAESPDFGSEDTLHAGPANHFKGLEAVGGHLWLTSQRLHFRSHKMNLQNHEWSTPLADIVSVQTSKSLGIIPNGLRVRLSSGEEHRFVVHENKRWVNDITQARQAV